MPLNLEHNRGSTPLQIDCENTFIGYKHPDRDVTLHPASVYLHESEPTHGVTKLWNSQVSFTLVDIIFPDVFTL